MQNIPELNGALASLSAALSELGLRYALIGGIAVILRGYDRATQDVDAVVLDSDETLPAILKTFERHGLQLRIADAEAFARRNRVILLQASDGTGIDVSMGLLPFETELVERATLEPLTHAIEVPVATAEDLIIMKLVAARDRDLDDVRRLIELHPNLNGGRIRKIVSEYAEALDQPEIVHHLDAIVGHS
ncbi:MAG TPA: nucleotidyl transferase AbiEii/AbiGii toxin family protein [Fimbriimonadaceae bacterium]|nr:nucleotidyl transferase AbiEii/AbiGii toxin family protein [Fimbriimonadaceae bacterium]